VLVACAPAHHARRMSDCGVLALIACLPARARLISNS
jgi:hypothetical protein